MLNIKPWYRVNKKTEKIGLKIKREGLERSKFF
jgi:hypothetical protein